jgi:hypothetical protein
MVRIQNPETRTAVTFLTSPPDRVRLGLTPCELMLGGAIDEHHRMIFEPGGTAYYNFAATAAITALGAQLGVKPVGVTYLPPSME